MARGVEFTLALRVYTCTKIIIWGIQRASFVAINLEEHSESITACMHTAECRWSETDYWSACNTKATVFGISYGPCPKDIYACDMFARADVMRVQQTRVFTD